MELQASGERDEAWYDRGRLSFRGFQTAHHLYTGRAASEDTVMRRRDSIIDALHKLRERIGRAHAFDADRIAATIRQHEREAGHALIAAAPERPIRQTQPRSRRAAQA